MPCVSPQPLAFPPAVPAGLLAPPAAALQCCLAGLGPLGGGVVWRENTLYASLNLGDPAYSLQVEVELRKRCQGFVSSNFTNMKLQRAIRQVLELPVPDP